MLSIYSTFDVSHLEMSESKEDALANMFLMSVTFDVSQFEMSELLGSRLPGHSLVRA